MEILDPKTLVDYDFLPSSWWEAEGNHVDIMPLNDQTLIMKVELSYEIWPELGNLNCCVFENLLSYFSMIYR